MRKIMFLSALFVSLFLVGCSKTMPTYDGTLKEKVKKPKCCVKKALNKKKTINEPRLINYTYTEDFPVTIRKNSNDIKGNIQ